MRPGAGRWVVLAAIGAGALALAAIALLGDDSGSGSLADGARSAAAGRPGENAGGPGDDPEAGSGDEEARRAIRPVLRRAVLDAARLGDGTVQAAVMLDGWSDPLVAASEPGAGQRPMRMWSIAKVVTAVALLRELGWQTPGQAREPSDQVAVAMRDALVRSENCRQRRMVLGLQALAGGPEGARAALRDVLRDAGADADLGVDVEAPEPLCHEYLETQRGSIADPFAPTLLLGTATWRIADLARFFHALGSGGYGERIRRYLFGLMRAPKERSTEVPPGEFTADLAWGAGNALAGYDPAYKAGWGGTLQGAFMAAQAAAVELEDGRTMVFAVAFHPSTQPPKDDPGSTAAPAAIERVMGLLADELFEPAPRTGEGGG